MKHSIIITAILLIYAANQTMAQSPLPVNRAQLNVGAGLSGWGVPVYLGFDYSVHKDVTIGAEFSYRSYNEYWRKYYYRHNITGISANFNYHFNTVLKIPRNWDLYAGMNIGYYVWSSPYDYYGNYRTGLRPGIQVGGRYYFTDKVGLNLEFGSGIAFSGGKFGLSIKL